MNQDESRLRGRPRYFGMDENDVPPSHESLGHYRLIAEIGRGGMARVYLAVAPGLAGFNKLLVIKQIDKHYAEDPDFLAMFLDEARLAARLSHANIVQTYQIGEQGGQYFIAMEYLEGQSLHHVLRRLKRMKMPFGLYIRILIDALAGLEYAHNLADYDGTPLQVVHRDVSPQNVFVTYDGRVKIVDFGIAKALGSSSETQKGILKGKLTYMSPEQARSEKVDRRSDVFSVGVMLWEAVTQRPLWQGMNDIEILRRLQLGDIPALDPALPALSARLDDVCRKALAPQREDRYASAAELQAALEGLLEETHDKAQLRDLGKLLAQAFEVERAKVQAAVEAHFRTITSPSGRPPNVSAPEEAGLATRPRPRSQSAPDHATPLPSVTLNLALQRPSANDITRSMFEAMPDSMPNSMPDSMPNFLPRATLQSTSHSSSDSTSDSTATHRSELTSNLLSSSLAPPRQSSRNALTVGLFLVGSILVGFAAAALVFTGGRAPANTLPSGAPAAPTTAVTANADPRPTSNLDAKTAGAAVTEAGQNVGTTPLTQPPFSLRPRGVTSAPARRPTPPTGTASAASIAPVASVASAASVASVERPPPAGSAAPGSIKLRTSR